MKIGTKSLLFGVHQFIWHPLTVFLAWLELYGYPSWQECICILVHDIGYVGCPDMDGEYGSEHPMKGAWIAHKLCDPRRGSAHGHKYFTLVLLHSRHYARMLDVKPSKLCWADKLSIKYDPWFLYIPRAILTGELLESHKLAAKHGHIPLSFSNREWYKAAREQFVKIGYLQEKAGDAFMKDWKRED